MKFIDLLMSEYEYAVNDKYEGGCALCPCDYEYEEESDCTISDLDCEKCWNREVTGYEQKS